MVSRGDHIRERSDINDADMLSKDGIKEPSTCSVSPVEENPMVSQSQCCSEDLGARTGWSRSTTADSSPNQQNYAGENAAQGGVVGSSDLLLELLLEAKACGEEISRRLQRVSPACGSEQWPFDLASHGIFGFIQHGTNFCAMCGQSRANNHKFCSQCGVSFQVIDGPSDPSRGVISLIGGWPIFF